MGVGMGLIDERDWGTLQRLRVTGAPLVAILAGKLCSRFVAGLFQMTVLFVAGWTLFGISLGRAPAMLIVPTMAIVFAATAFSLLIACIARTHDSVMPIGAVTAMAMSAIGGCWWPLDFEPGWIRVLARWVPTTWTMQAYNDLMIRHGPAVGALWPSACAAALGCIYLTIGMITAIKLYR
jgi:ABC-2 type transport system permease protein